MSEMNPIIEKQSTFLMEMCIRACFSLYNLKSTGDLKKDLQLIFATGQQQKMLTATFAMMRCIVFNEGEREKAVKEFNKQNNIEEKNTKEILQKQGEATELDRVNSSDVKPDEMVTDPEIDLEGDVKE